MDIDEMIKQVEESIFSFDETNIPGQFTDLMTALIEKQAIDTSNIQKLQTFNQLMKASLQALQNMDYLLLADIIEFELKPILNSGLKN